MFHTLRKDPSLTGLAGGGSFLWQVFRREISEKREDAGQPLLRFPACIMKKFIPNNLWRLVLCLFSMVTVYAREMKNTC